MLLLTKMYNSEHSIMSENYASRLVIVAWRGSEVCLGPSPRARSDGDPQKKTGGPDLELFKGLLKVE